MTKGAAERKKSEMKKGDIPTDTTEIEKIVRDFYEQSHSNKFDNLEEKDEFLDTFTLFS